MNTVTQFQDARSISAEQAPPSGIAPDIWQMTYECRSFGLEYHQDDRGEWRAVKTGEPVAREFIARKMMVALDDDVQAPLEPVASATRASFDAAAALTMIEAYGIDRRMATFQVLKKLPSGKNVTRKTIVGFTADNIAKLAALHDEEGFGISIMLQETDGKGRKTENVTAFKTVSVDGAPSQPVPTEWPGGLTPFEVIEIRPGSWQAHWRLDGQLAPTEGVLFTTAMTRALAADMGAVNVTQPWRLAGSCHPKHHEHVRSLGRTGKLTPIAALQEALRAQLAEIKAEAAERARPASAASPEASASGSDADKARWLLARYPIVVQGRKAWLKIGRAIFNTIGGDEGFAFWLEISKRSPGRAKAYEADCRAEWRLFGRTKGKPATLGSIIHEAKASGLDTMAFHAAFPGVQKRKRALEATLPPMGWAKMDNARFGAIDHLLMPYDARHEAIFIRGLGRLPDGSIPHSPADSERLRHADGRMVSDTVRYLAEIGDIQVVREAGKSVGILKVTGTDWGSKPRPGDIESFHGNMVSADGLKGFTLVPNAIWTDATWLAASPAERELCLFSIAVASGSDKVFELSHNFITAHTGIGKNANALLKRLVEMDMLTCIREGVARGEVGLYRLGEWTKGMLGRVVLSCNSQHQ